MNNLSTYACPNDTQYLLSWLTNGNTGEDFLTLALWRLLVTKKALRFPLAFSYWRDTLNTF